MSLLTITLATDIREEMSDPRGMLKGTQKENRLEKALLVFIDGVYVDIVRESCYRNVLTVRASDKKSLQKVASCTSADIVQVPHPYYPFIVHIDEYVIPINFHHSHNKNIEVLDRLTPEPVCFVYEYAYEEQDGSVTGEYGYCYPDEVQSTSDYLMSQERQPINEPVFLPLFYFPGELIGAPVPWPDGDFEAKGYDESNDSENPDEE